MAFDLVSAQRARLADSDGATVDIAVAGGRIAAIAPKIPGWQRERGCRRTIRLSGAGGVPFSSGQVAHPRPRGTARGPARDRLHGAHRCSQAHVHGRRCLYARPYDARAVHAERRRPHAHAHRGGSQRRPARFRRDRAPRKGLCMGHGSAVMRLSAGRLDQRSRRGRPRARGAASARSAQAVGGAPRYDTDGPAADPTHFRAREGIRR